MGKRKRKDKGKGKRKGKGKGKGNNLFTSATSYNHVTTFISNPWLFLNAMSSTPYESELF